MALKRKRAPLYDENTGTLLAELSKDFIDEDCIIPANVRVYVMRLVHGTDPKEDMYGVVSTACVTVGGVLHSWRFSVPTKHVRVVFATTLGQLVADGAITGEFAERCQEEADMGG